MLLLAGFQVFCARVANTLLTSWSPLTYERGDYSDGTEKLDPDWEPTGKFGAALQRVQKAGNGEAVDPPLADWERELLDLPTGFTHDHAAGVEAPTPPAAFKLPMFEFSDLQAIASDYLVNHFPWPDGDGKFGCTCGTQGFTIATWAAHVGELQISELVFYLTGLLYDQSQQSP